ncbi:DeoR family transcriptional regulator [Oligoflexus tunisiensis]|uniref:DeoR family transcriptional regulator n=1 Tax=Oligoflexus tunisiensis TaxID=708132 RepID=UPI00114CD5AE|nr:DeoR family transcriptional regulator [Oligoflexus tunisiensis]
MDLQKLEELFVRGEHHIILKETVDRPDFRRPAEGQPYLIGSLCFVGRLPEARTLLGLWRPHLSDDTLAASLAYVAIAAARQGSLSEALRDLRELGRIQRRHPTPLSQFFRHQATAFYYWRRHRISIALYYAEQALSAAWAAEFFFGRALATDLMGHLQINLGQIQKGMASLEKAHQYFSSLGHCQHVQIIETALAGYQLETKPFGADALASLRQKIGSLSLETNNYSLSYLYLELGHQLALRGDLQGSSEALDEAGGLIQRFGHRRHHGLLLFRKAYLAYLSGRDQSAIQYLDDLNRFAREDFDERLLIKVSGLKRLIRREEDSPDMQRFVQHWLRKYSYAISRRIEMRRHGQKQTADWAQDPMGDFLDSLESPDLSALAKVQHILKSGLLSLLYKQLPISREDRVLYFDLEPQSLFIFDQGDIIKSEAAVTLQMQKFVRLLLNGPQTKAALVEGIWNYTYHPLRHDPLIYGLVYRLRSVLGSREDWINSHGEGYCLRPDIKVNFFPLYESLPVAAAEDDERSHSTDLNIRQLKILQYLRENETVDIQAYVHLFQTSKVTASRDLSNLTERGLLMRTGKGRNTCYALPQNIQLEEGNHI